jgi:hypothetical protein
MASLTMMTYGDLATLPFSPPSSGAGPGDLATSLLIPQNRASGGGLAGDLATSLLIPQNLASGMSLMGDPVTPTAASARSAAKSFPENIIVGE